MGKHGFSRENNDNLYTLHMEKFTIGLSSVPSTQDMMFNYDQGKLHKLKGIVAQIKGLFLPRLPGM